MRAKWRPGTSTSRLAVSNDAILGQQCFLVVYDEAALVAVGRPPSQRRESSLFPFFPLPHRRLARAIHLPFCTQTATEKYPEPDKANPKLSQRIPGSFYVGAEPKVSWHTSGLSDHTRWYYPRLKVGPVPSGTLWTTLKSPFFTASPMPSLLPRITFQWFLKNSYQK